jgi:hypothetical protein
MYTCSASDVQTADAVMIRRTRARDIHVECFFLRDAPNEFGYDLALYFIVHGNFVANEALEGAFKVGINALA